MRGGTKSQVQVLFVPAGIHKLSRVVCATAELLLGLDALLANVSDIVILIISVIPCKLASLQRMCLTGAGQAADMLASNTSLTKCPRLKQQKAGISLVTKRQIVRTTPC